MNNGWSEKSYPVGFLEAVEIVLALWSNSKLSYILVLAWSLRNWLEGYPKGRTCVDWLEGCPQG